MNEALTADLVRACAKCDHVAAAYVSPHAHAFVVVAVVGVRERSLGKDGTAYGPLFPDEVATRELSALVKKVRDKHDVFVGWFMATRSLATSWPKVYEKVARVALKDDAPTGASASASP